MPSQLGIFNNALRLLGEPEIAAVTSETKYAKRLSNAWNDEVRSWFEDKDWIFATKEVQLARTVPDVSGWAYTFNRPVNCYRILRVSSSTQPNVPGVDYDMVLGQIQTNYEATFLRYVDGNIVDQAGSWPQKFADALAARLAEAVYPATDETNSTRDRIEKVRMRRVKDAKAFDDQQRAQRRPPEGRFSAARRQGVNGYNRRGY